jgi:hypothetical protein
VFWQCFEASYGVRVEWGRECRSVGGGRARGGASVDMTRLT